MFLTVFSIVSSTVQSSRMILLEVWHCVLNFYGVFCHSTIKSTFVWIFLLCVDSVAIYILCSLSSDSFVPVLKGFIAKNCLIRKTKSKHNKIGSKDESEISTNSRAVSANGTSSEQCVIFREFSCQTLSGRCWSYQF